MISNLTIGALCAKHVVAAVTWNPSDKGTDATLSGGNLHWTNTTANTDGLVRATTSHSTGKYYFEFLISVSGAVGLEQVGFVLAGTAYTVKPGQDGSTFGMRSDGAVFDKNVNTFNFTGFAATDVMGIAIDFGASKMWAAKNNTWYNSGNPSAGTGAIITDIAGTLFPAVNGVNAGGGGPAGTARFASGSFTYTAPSGFSPW